MTMPATTRPCSEIPPDAGQQDVASSLENPVIFVPRGLESARARSAATRSRCRALPRCLEPGPWEMPIVTIITASEPTSATSSAGSPPSIAGDENSTTMPEADPEAHQRADALQAPEQHDQPGEHDDQQEQVRRALEVDERERLLGGIVDRQLLDQLGIQSGRDRARDANALTRRDPRGEPVVRKRDRRASTFRWSRPQLDLGNTATWPGPTLTAAGRHAEHVSANDIADPQRALGLHLIARPQGDKSADHPEHESGHEPGGDAAG